MYPGLGTGEWYYAVDPLTRYSNGGELNAGSSFNNIQDTVPVNQLPPPGTYMATLFLEEFFGSGCTTDDQYCSVAYMPLATPVSE